MEIGMQHFNVNDLPPEDQDTVRKFYFRMFFVYAGVFALAGLAILARMPGAELQVAKQAGEISPARSVFGVLAPVAFNRALCTERDQKLVTRLNEHGEAQDVPAADLRNAFLALVDARKNCLAGRVEEALAIYDGVTFTGGKTAQVE